MKMIMKIKEWLRNVRGRYEMLKLQYKLQESIYEDKYGDPDETDTSEVLKNIIKGDNNDGE